MLAVLEMRFVGCWLWVSHQAASRWRLRVPAEPAVDLRVLCGRFQKLRVGIVRQGHSARRHGSTASVVRVVVWWWP